MSDAGLGGCLLERLGRHVGVGDAGRAGGDRDDRPACTAGRRRGGRGSVAAAARWAGSSSVTTDWIRATASSGVAAERSPATNSGRTRARASMVSTLRWVASPPSGAAIRKDRSAGPSLAPKSTAGERRAKARVGTSTARGAAVRDGDATGQPGVGRRLPGHRVGDEQIGVPGPPGSGHDGGKLSDDLGLVGAEIGVETYEIRGDHVGHGVSERRLSELTRTRSGRACEGLGMVVPGRPAAALP